METINLSFNEDGVAEWYNDEYDIVIHCESEEDQEEAMQALKNARMWIPVTEQLPEPETYVLVSFSNFSLPIIGRYDGDKEGGVWFAGDEEESLVSQDLFVNAWMPLPELYREETEDEETD